MTNEEYLKSISEPRAICILILKNCEVEGQLHGWPEDSNVIKRLCSKYNIDHSIRGCKKELHKKMLLSWLEEECNEKDL